ncbi:hypothetical protein [Kitasatospora sp. NPDC057541]|uniref:hypothetical protein n=1 Tax=unclassified Kitasatospora TaxID=2633591 RepID=UPI0036871653
MAGGGAWVEVRAHLRREPGSGGGGGRGGGGRNGGRAGRRTSGWVLAGAAAVFYLYGHFVGYRDDAAGPVPATPAASAEASASSIAGAP